MDVKINSFPPLRTLFGSLTLALSLLSCSALVYADPGDDEERPAKRQKTAASVAEAQRVNALPKPCSRPLSECDFDTEQYHLEVRQLLREAYQTEQCLLDVRQRMKEARQHYFNGRYQDTLTVLNATENFLYESPGCSQMSWAILKYHQAQYYLKAKEYSSALLYMQESIDLGGYDFSQALGQQLLMGECQAQLANLEAARSYFIEALGILDHPGPHETRYNPHFKAITKAYIHRKIENFSVFLQPRCALENNDVQGMSVGGVTMGDNKPFLSSSYSTSVNFEDEGETMPTGASQGSIESIPMEILPMSGREESTDTYSTASESSSEDELENTPLYKRLTKVGRAKVASRKRKRRSSENPVAMETSESDSDIGAEKHKTPSGNIVTLYL